VGKKRYKKNKTKNKDQSTGIKRQFPKHESGSTSGYKQHVKAKVTKRNCDACVLEEKKEKEANSRHFRAPFFRDKHVDLFNHCSDTPPLHSPFSLSASSRHASDHR